MSPYARDTFVGRSSLHYRQVAAERAAYSADEMTERAKKTVAGDQDSEFAYAASYHSVSAPGAAIQKTAVGGTARFGEQERERDHVVSSPLKRQTGHEGAALRDDRAAVLNRVLASRRSADWLRGDVLAAQLARILKNMDGVDARKLAALKEQQQEEGKIVSSPPFSSLTWCAVNRNVSSTEVVFEAGKEQLNDSVADNILECSRGEKIAVLFRDSSLLWYCAVLGTPALVGGKSVSVFPLAEGDTHRFGRITENLDNGLMEGDRVLLEVTHRLEATYGNGNHA